MVVAKKHHELYEELGAIVGAKYVSDDYGVLLSYTRDMSPFPPARPQGIVVRPGSIEEVVELVRLANQTRTPLSPIGGRATLTGVPPGQPGRGIVVDMKRMDKVIEIDEKNMAVTVQCGITLGEMRNRVNERGWTTVAASSPSYIDTVGGQLSGYPGGGVSTYGFSVGGNTNFVLGLKVVLPNGSVVDTGTGKGSISTDQNHTWSRGMNGPDLTGMFIGDGGVFGIKVEATYRVFRPAKFQKIGLRCWGVDKLDEAYEAFRELWEIHPYIYMQPFAKLIMAGPEFGGIVGAKPAWTLFYYNIGNSEEEVELKAKYTETILAKHGGNEPEPALAALMERSMETTEELGRGASLGLQPYFDFIVSPKDFLESFKWGREYMLNQFRERGILSDLSDTTKIKFVAILLPYGPGCGVVSLIPYFDQNDRELNRVMPEMMKEFFDEVNHRGYVVEAPQGYESRVKAKQWTPEFYNHVLTLKKTLDPNNIMNPGVYFL